MNEEEIKILKHIINRLQDSVFQLEKNKLILCQDCKYWHDPDSFDICIDFKENDFCSYGIKKE